jgi:hypothetical protein
MTELIRTRDIAGRFVPFSIALACGAAAALGAGCGGGGSHPSPPPNGYRSEIDVERFRSYLPGVIPGTFLFVQATFQEPLPANGYLDAGARVTITGPAGPMTLIRNNVFQKLLYQKDPAGPELAQENWVASSDYSAKGSGTSLNGGVPSFTVTAAVHTPDAFTLLSPDIGPGQIDVDGTTDLPLTWTPGNGDYVLVVLAVATNGSGQYRTYHVTDSGSFAVPASGIDSLPKGIGTLTIERVIERNFTLPDLGTGVGIGSDAVECRLVHQ